MLGENLMEEAWFWKAPIDQFISIKKRQTITIAADTLVQQHSCYVRTCKQCWSTEGVHVTSLAGNFCIFPHTFVYALPS